MEKHVLYQRIANSLEDIERLNRLLYSMSSTDIQKFPDNYEVLSVEAALRAEKIACRLRHLIYQSTKMKKREYLETSAEEMGILIAYNEEIFKVEIPGLMPKRKQSQSTEFLLDPLYFALNRFMDNQLNIPRYKECVVHFKQEYDASLPGRRMRDFDNLELKQVLDVITAFVLVDDGGEICEVHHANGLGWEDRTVITILGKDIFPSWYAAQKSE